MVEMGIACVLVAYNSELTYHGITDVCRILSCKNTDYIAANPDLVCPTDFGFVPDCGSICQMLEHAVKREPVFLGKPAPSMIELAVTLQHCSKEETLVVGDRLYTDILCGYRAGVIAAVSGCGSRETVEVAPQAAGQERTPEQEKTVEKEKTVIEYWHCNAEKSFKGGRTGRKRPADMGTGQRICGYGKG